MVAWSGPGSTRSFCGAAASTPGSSVFGEGYLLEDFTAPARFSEALSLQGGAHRLAGGRDGGWERGPHSHGGLRDLRRRRGVLHLAAHHTRLSGSFLQRLSCGIPVRRAARLSRRYLPAARELAAVVLHPPSAARPRPSLGLPQRGSSLPRRQGRRG